jgi:hypothetical protein
MGFKTGIVGLPNVGKSTLFSALTASQAEAENYPFCTIEPNVGMVKVPDPRLKQINECIPTEKVIPALMEFVDIAGLVKGASQGEGLGNQFLSHIREVQAIAHVVRCFESDDVVHVEGQVDPIQDIETIETELQLADLETVSKKLPNVEKQAKSGDKTARQQLGVLRQINDCLEAGRSLRALDLSDEDFKKVYDLHLITRKPVLYVCNVSEEDIGKSPSDIPLVQKVIERAEQEDAKLVTICGKMEAELAQMEEEERQEFLQELGASQSGLEKMIQTGYELLGLITYFTAGPKEIKAWTIEKDTKAPQAAGKIHSDFERGFIRAEIYHVDDLIKHGSENKIKEAGLMRSEGKEYVVKDGDIIHFRFNV